MMEAFQAEGHNVSGTCRTPTHTALLPFDLDQPQAIVPLLERVRPDVVVSCLRGEFSRQLEAHRLLAEFLSRHHGTLVYLSTANVFDGDLSRLRGRSAPAPQCLRTIQSRVRDAFAGPWEKASSYCAHRRFGAWTVPGSTT